MTREQLIDRAVRACSSNGKALPGWLKQYRGRPPGWMLEVVRANFADYTRAQT